MFVREVNDDQLEKLIDGAKSPVVVLFMGGARERIELAFSRLVTVAEAHDDVAIFLRINADENPTASRQWAKARDLPVTLFIENGRIAGVCEDGTSSDDIALMVGRILKRRGNT